MIIIFLYDLLNHPLNLTDNTEQALRIGEVLLCSVGGKAVGCTPVLGEKACVLLGNNDNKYCVLSNLGFVVLEVKPPYEESYRITS